MPFFSAEVIDTIIDAIPEEDKATIKACSLVCRSWRPRSHFRLLTTISLMSYPENMTADAVRRRGEEFAKLAKDSDTLKTTLRRLVVPHFVSLEHFPFTNLTTLLLYTQRCWREALIVIKVANESPDPESQHLISFLRKNPHIRQLAIDAFQMDKKFLFNVFDAIGALKDEPSKLQWLSFDRCVFDLTLPDDAKPHNLKFYDLGLRLGDNRFFDRFVRAFRINNLHRISITDLEYQNENKVEAIATLINQHRKELRRLSLVGLHNLRPEAICMCPIPCIDSPL
ncbi:hypothetical protein K435DRAFT_431705 [Dendrothele bispora CBS 962.96]|uniref:F-box domain-containing protein n=1 Tax=Dendrothele bispora (strain CBS 962.96) TaxID=1314807 RepID=A0A4S8MEQ8_DENBC|nr:hypothetical protein K435DRAFT_431705 [Dendrothele bispora CBS 962.96]